MPGRGVGLYPSGTIWGPRRYPSREKRLHILGAPQLTRSLAPVPLFYKWGSRGLERGCPGSRQDTFAHDRCASRGPNAPQFKKRGGGARPDWELGGWMQTPVQTRTHACVDPSPAQGPEVEPNHYASTPPCPHNAWAPLSARRPTHSRDSFHSGPRLQPLIFAWKPPFHSHCPGRLHGCQVETEASLSLRPPQLPYSASAPLICALLQLRRRPGLT